MSAHRFRTLLSSTPACVAPAPADAFMPCPASLLSLYTESQQQFIREVYRVAREQTEAQFRPAVRLPEFSSN